MSCCSRRRPPTTCSCKVKRCAQPKAHPPCHHGRLGSEHCAYLMQCKAQLLQPTPSSDSARGFRHQLQHSANCSPCGQAPRTAGRSGCGDAQVAATSASATDSARADRPAAARQRRRVMVRLQAAARGRLVFTAGACASTCFKAAPSAGPRGGEGLAPQPCPTPAGVLSAAWTAVTAEHRCQTI